VKPEGCTKIRVQVQASGGGGRNWGHASGAGGYSEKLIDVSEIDEETVTVGAAPATSGAGNSSSFGAHCSATGGLAPSTRGGYGGVGTGGDINVRGGGGDSGGNISPYTSYEGGSSYFGSGSHGYMTTNVGDASQNGAYGSGGGAAHNGYTALPNPPGGIVIVWEYA
jgi:hypothetical protein